jgi:hypothetical protein
LEKIIEETGPGFPSDGLRKQTLLVCNSEVAFISHKPCVGQEKAASSYKQSSFLTKYILPAFDLKQKCRKWLNENSTFMPNMPYEMLVRIFRD